MFGSVESTGPVNHNIPYGKKNATGLPKSRDAYSDPVEPKGRSCVLSQWDVATCVDTSYFFSMSHSGKKLPVVMQRTRITQG